MPDDYQGSLTPDQQASVEILLRTNSVREVAKLTDISYGKVRGYAEWLADNPLDLIPPPETGPRILLFDIETSPELAWGFFHKKYQVNINTIERHWHLLCFAYRWYGQEEIGLVSQRHDPKYTPGTEDDRHVALRLHRLLTQADIVIAHNGDRFDIKKANSRFLINDLGPPSPFESIDTVSEAKRHLGETSNSLKDLTTHYELPMKLDNGGFPLWLSIVKTGDDESWEEMEVYNVHDVISLEAWYEKLRPFIGHNGRKKHPNLGHYYRTTDPVCPNCASRSLTVRKWTPYRTAHYEYATMRCNDCGRYSRQAGVRRVIDPEDRIYAV